VRTWLLNLIYLALLVLALPWLMWQAWRHGKYRQGWHAKFWGLVPIREGNRPCLWLHAVSVGEVNLLPTLLARLEREYPGWDIVISSSTHTGYTLARKKYAPRLVFYAPLDFSWAVHAALQRIRPQLLVLAELELWPNLIHGAKRAGVRVAIMNGRLGERSYRGYRRLGHWLRPLFQKLDLVAAQTEEYATRFRELGVPADRVHVTGSLKFDGAVCDPNNPQTARLAQLAGIAPSDLVFLAGSTQAPEEEYALEAYRRLCTTYPRLRLILVPRHPERFDEVAGMLNRSGLPWVRRSRLDPHSPPAERILLVDAVGELPAWWGTARIGFVGGSMGSRGGQNMIEPAAYGVATCFGPNTWNFRDVVARFLAAEAGVVVRNRVALTEFLARCLADVAYREALGERGAELVRQQQGATEQTLALLRPLLGTKGPGVPVDPLHGLPRPHGAWSSVGQFTPRS
jgi:3-deoxy-D-manno-octulosonic-acid transferase